MACNQELREQGYSYPRTCRDCRLGPCKRPPQQDLRAEIERLKRELEITHNSRNELAETWKDRAIKAEVEIERLTKERDSSKELLRSCIQGNNALRKKAQKAAAERDEARASLRHMEGFERCTCGPCAIHGTTTLADTEQYMGQIHAECDCPHPDRCTSHCIAERNK